MRQFGVSIKTYRFRKPAKYNNDANEDSVAIFVEFAKIDPQTAKRNKHKLKRRKEICTLSDKIFYFNMKKNNTKNVAGTLPVFKNVILIFILYI